MKALVLCLLSVFVVRHNGCAVQEEPPQLAQEDRQQPEAVAKPELPQSAKQVERTPYEQYHKQYWDKSRTVVRGKPFMVSDEESLKMNGQPVVFNGSDEYGNLVYQYENVVEFRGRQVSNPIILPAQIKGLEGEPMPLETMMGDWHIAGHLIRILEVTDQECRYYVEPKESSE